MRSLRNIELSHRQKRYDDYESGNLNIRHLLGHRIANRIVAMLYINGAIAFDSDHKKDRNIAKERSVDLLRKGENLIIFPEGAYNISRDNMSTLELVLNMLAEATTADIEAAKVYISTLDRSLQTAKMLFRDRDFCKTDQINEVPLKSAFDTAP
ncbi:MAG: 1-acyl-sn-glycerol-3-phosphate acyltransferase [Butyrivibrio sp.]|nr:1-acyl-sn-glycerol-3-phosphate acyltransferase [Butyrivibrio sp.]